MPLKYAINSKTSGQGLYGTKCHAPRIDRFLYLKQLITVIEATRIGFTPDADIGANSIAGRRTVIEMQ